MARKYQDDEDEDPWLKEVTNADVFVMYNNEDEYEISKYIFSIFDQNNVIYVSPAEHIMPGNRTYSAIDQAIQASNKMLLIMSRESIDKFSFSLETLLALEKSLQTNKLNLIILLKDGLQVDDVPKLPLLQCASQIVLESNLHERCIEKVIHMIKDDVSLDQILPCGNLAAGMAWSHFTGYLELVLQQLAEQIKKTEWFQDNPGRMPLCLFMLVPYSARSTGSLGDEDPDVENVGTVEIFLNGRNYGPTVYKVTEKDKKGQKLNEYYCAAQYPGAFTAIGTIQREIHCRLTKQEKEAEVKRFHHYMGMILNHEKYRQFGTLAKMLLYDDEEKSDTATVSNQLINGCKDVLRQQVAMAGDVFKANITKEKDKFNEQVCLLYHQQDEKDAFPVRDFLTEKGIKCSKARPGGRRSDSSTLHHGGDTLVQIEERVRNARWTLLFITEKSKKEAVIDMYLAELLSIAIEDNSLKVIPILKGVLPSELPSFIRWTMHITIDKEENYLQMIYDAIIGQEVSMKSQIPVGNVAYGLAWAFFVNYLRHVLPDIPERIEKCRKEESNICKYRASSKKNLVVSKCLWEIVPTSCTYHPTLSEVDNQIKGPWKVDDIVRPLHGAKRVFPCNLWMISTTDTDYFFAGEFLTPVKTLYNMHISMIAGLSYDQMMKQRADLTEQLQGILHTAAKNEDFENKCCVIEYDDTKDEPLSSFITNEINKETGHKDEHRNLLRFLSKNES